MLAYGAQGSDYSQWPKQAKRNAQQANLKKADFVCFLGLILLNNTDIAKQLMMKRVNEVAARMSMITLRPGQKLNLEEPSMYIVLDGALRITTND